MAECVKSMTGEDHTQSMTQEKTAVIETVEICYSADKRHYYIVDDADPVNRPQSWVPVGATGDVLPFAFWALPSVSTATVSRSDPMVIRYGKADGWLPFGTDQWRESARRQLKNARRSVDDAEKTLAYYLNRERRLSAALLLDAARHASSVEDSNG
jgi:hypothetical protein